MAKVDVSELNLNLRKEAPKGGLIKFKGLRYAAILLVALFIVGVKVNELIHSGSESDSFESNNGVVTEQDTEGAGQLISEVRYKAPTLNYTDEIARAQNEESEKIAKAKAEVVENNLMSDNGTNEEPAEQEESSDWWQSNSRRAEQNQEPQESNRDRSINEGIMLSSKVDLSFGGGLGGNSGASGSRNISSGMGNLDMLGGAGMPSMPNLDAERENANRQVNELVRGMQETDPVVSQNQQREKQGYIDEENSDFINSGMLRSAPSPYLVRAGDNIPVVLLRGVNTDLPGEVMALVERDVYDSVTGQHLLIPKMSRVIGTYQSVLSYGQERILSAWVRLDLPNGDRIALDTFTAADLNGFAGFKGEVDTHTWSTISGAFLSSVISVGSAAGQNPYGSEISGEDIARRGIAESASTVGEEHVSRTMNRQNTLTALIGKRFVINVNKDLLLRPYTSAP